MMEKIEDELLEALEPMVRERLSQPGPPRIVVVMANQKRAEATALALGERLGEPFLRSSGGFVMTRAGRWTPDPSVRVVGMFTDMIGARMEVVLHEPDLDRDHAWWKSCIAPRVTRDEGEVLPIIADRPVHQRAPEQDGLTFTSKAPGGA